MDISGKHIVVDLETLSTHSNACIVSIGAVLIEDLKKQGEFYINVNGIEGRQAGLHIETDTIKWWEEQSQEARDAWQLDPQPLVDSLNEFKAWYGDESIPIWGYGANFDVVILENAYRTMGMEIPWKFWDIYCLRTVMNVLNKRLPKANNHNALDDANAEADMLIEILKS